MSKSQTTRQYTGQILKQYGLKAKKKYGQNFLCDETVLDGIVLAAGVEKNDSVLEIGPGIGSLTERLLEAAEYVTAVEIDPDMVKILRERFKDYNNLTICNEDILTLDPTELMSHTGEGRIKVVANLPYYITTPILMYLMEGELWQYIDSITVMVQSEVARRLVAKPGSREYGAITLAIDYRCRADIAIEVPAEAFLPAPEVESAVVVLKRYENPPILLRPKEEKRLFSLIKAAFSVRRKTLVNALSIASYAGGNKDEIKRAIAAIGVREDVRGEALSLEQYVRLSEQLNGD